MELNTGNIRGRITDPKVRSACDRCRSQKLKCDRFLAHNGDGRCTRCAKAEQDCVTSAPRPSGRPSRHPVRKQARLSKGAHYFDTFAPATQSFTTRDTSEDSMHHLVDNAALSGQLGASTFPFDVFDDTIFSAFMPDDFSTVNEPFACDRGSSSFVSHTDDQSRTTLSMVDIDTSTGTASGSYRAAELQPRSLNTRDQTHYLKRLTEINSTLLQHLAEIDKLVYADCCKTSSSTLIFGTTYSSLHSHQTASNLGVKEILGFLQDFTSILIHLAMSLPIISAPRSISYTRNETAEIDSDCSDVEITRPPTPRSSESRSDSRQSNKTDMNSQERSPVADYPTVLALTTCYVSLIRLYRAAFMRILVAMESCSRQETIPSPAELPPLLPHLDVDGYAFASHRTMQISVFMHVSLECFWRAEKVITAIVAAEYNSPVTSSSGYMLLFETMLKQEAATADLPARPHRSQERVNGTPIGRQSLKLLAKQIRALYRANICLQLEEAAAC